MLDSDAPLPDSDESETELLRLARDFDQPAIAELWRRHSSAARAVAHAFSPSFDAEDVASEAFTKVLSAMRSGNGPTSLFRPYFLTAVRNVASTWGLQRNEVPMGDMQLFEEAYSNEDSHDTILDRGTVLAAFKSLPSRWQEVLWLSEVEGLLPTEFGPQLGLNSSGASALVYRAREGLRQAWISAHLAATSDDPECHWVTERLGGHVRGRLSRRDQRRLQTHLDECQQSCPERVMMADQIGSRLLGILFPVLLGSAGAAAAYTAPAGKLGAATAATVSRKRFNFSFTRRPSLTHGLLVGGLVVGAVLIGSGALALTASRSTTGPHSNAIAAAPPATSPDRESVMPSVSPSAPTLPGQPAPAPAPEDQSLDPVPIPASTGGPVAPPVPISPPTRPSPATPAQQAPPAAGAPMPKSPQGPTSPPIVAPPVAAPPIAAPPIPGPPIAGPPIGTGLITPLDVTVDTGGGLYYPIVSGTGDPGDTVTLSSATGPSHTLVVGSDGTWSSGPLTDLPKHASRLDITKHGVKGLVSSDLADVDIVTPAVTVPVGTNLSPLVITADITGVPGATVQLVSAAAVSRLITIPASGELTVQLLDIARSVTRPGLSVRYSDDTRHGPSVPLFPVDSLP